MTATHGVGTYGNAVGTVTPLDHKMAQLGLVAKTAANTIRSGLFWDGSATIVSGKANMSYDVRAFTAVMSRGATAGAVLISNDAVYNATTTAAPGSNSRYDSVIIWQREYSLDGTNSEPVIITVQGTAAASPSAPSLAAYPGAIELARILVPSGVTATNSGTTITQTAPFTATSGGVVPCRTQTERDAGSWIEGQHTWEMDTDRICVYNGSAFHIVAQPATSYTPTISNYTSATTPPTTVGRYWISDGVCHVIVTSKLGTGSITVGNITVSLPVAASTTGLFADSSYFAGNVSMNDVTGSQYGGYVRYVDANTVRVMRESAGGADIRTVTSSTTPFTWATLDEISLAFSYPVA